MEKEIKKKNTATSETLKLVETINKAIIDKKGEEILNLNLNNTDNSVAASFIICHGNSKVHVNTIADYVQRYVRNELKERPWQKEGMENCHWVLLDYVDVVIHIFQKEYRDFYKLEELWADAETKKIDNLE